MQSEPSVQLVLVSATLTNSNTSCLGPHARDKGRKSSHFFPSGLIESFGAAYWKNSCVWQPANPNKLCRFFETEKKEIKDVLLWIDMSNSSKGECVSRGSVCPAEVMEADWRTTIRTGSQNTGSPPAFYFWDLSRPLLPGRAKIPVRNSG